MRVHEMNSVGKAIDKIRLSRFNQLEIAYKTSPGCEFRLPGKMVSVVGVFTPSPTCDLWFKSEDWPVGGDRAIRLRKMNAKAAETVVAFHHVSQKPSVFEAVIEIDSSDEPEAVLDAVAEWLARYVPKTLEQLGIFGCADAGGREFFVKIESNVLMTRKIRIMANVSPPAYPQLGERFDALHPLMFGGSGVCSGIASALGKNARFIPSSAFNDFGVIRLGPEYETPEARERVSGWMLSRKGSP